MRRLILGLTLGVSVLAAQAQRAPDPASAHHIATPLHTAGPAARAPAEPDEAQLLSHHHYKAKDGHEVHSPSKSTHDQVPAGASAKCRDGTYSFSQHRRGICSRHGGVADFL